MKSRPFNEIRQIFVNETASRIAAASDKSAVAAVVRANDLADALEKDAAPNCPWIKTSSNQQPALGPK